MTLSASNNYTRFQAPVFSDLATIPVFTLFQTIFAAPTGRTIITPNAEVVDINIQRGNKKKAVYIPRGSDANNIGDALKRGLLAKYTSDAKIYPLIEEVSPVTSVMVAKPLAQEDPRNPLDRMTRQAALAMMEHREHMVRIIREMEFSASESLRTGLQTIQGGLQYDFYRRASHTVNVLPAVWSTSATALPVTNLADAGTIIFRDGNRLPTDAIMGEGSWENFLATTQVKELADKRRINHFSSDMAATAPAGYEAWVAAGAIFQGRVKAGNWNLNLWTYPAIYDNDAGTQVQYMPDDQVVVMAKGARFDRLFGPADRLEISDDEFYSRQFGISLDAGVPASVTNSGIFSSNMFHLDAYGGGNNKALNIRTQIAPIFPTIETDTVVTLVTE